jgi:RNA polymerase-interacting CarD/CdnL/TRCF family regulator
VLAIDLESNGPHPEADNKILIKTQHVGSLVDQERQVLQEAREALGGELRFGKNFPPHHQQIIRQC